LNKDETILSSQDSENELIKIEDIKRDIDMLKVNNAKQCLLILCHSQRVYYDMEFCEGDLSIILMPWKEDIIYDTETRCFVKNKMLVALSQYYCDLPHGYFTLRKKFDMMDFVNQVKLFIDDLIINNKIPFDNAVVDVAVSNNVMKVNVLSNDNLIFIEINPFDQTTDSCLFEWSEIDLFVVDESPKFRYRNGDFITCM
jgi:hypothetical protein